MAIGWKQFSQIAFTTILLIGSQALKLDFLVSFAMSPVVAQMVNEQKAEADKLLEQGIQQAKTSQFEAAIQTWQQALIIYRQINDRQGEGKALGRMGNAYDSLGDYKKAIDYDQQSLAIAREIHDRQGEGTALGNLGIAYYSLGNYAKAIDYQQQSLAIAREIHDRQSEGTALGNLGIAYYSLGDYAKVIDYQQQWLAIAQEIHDRQSEGAALGNLGNAYDSLGDYQKAINYQQQFLAIAREIKDRASEGKALGSLGTTYLYLGDYAKAIDYYQQLLAIAREIKDRASEGAALGNLGNAYLSLGNYTKAIDYYQQLLAIAREIKDRASEGKALGYLGSASLNLGNYAKAIDYSQQWLAIAREIQDRQSEEEALGSLGIAYYSLGDFARAIAYEQQVLAIAWEIHDRQSEGKTLGNLGNAYLDLGDYAKAIDYYQQLLAIAREIKDRASEGKALGSLGTTYLSLGNYTKAIDYYQQVLVIAREIHDRASEGQSLGNLGSAYLNLRDYTKAINYSQQWLTIAQEIRNRASEGKALESLGLAYLNLLNYTKAIAYFHQSLEIAKEIKDRDIEEITLKNLGFTFYQKGQFTAAEAKLREGIKLQEVLRHQLGYYLNTKFRFKSTLKDESDTYRILQIVLVDEQKTDLALEVTENMRALASAESAEFVKLLTLSVEHNPTGQVSIPPPSIEKIKQLAKTENATIVEYWIINDDFTIPVQLKKESELYIWVIKPTGEVVFRKVDLKNLWQQHNSSLQYIVTNICDYIGLDLLGRSIFDVKVMHPVNQEELSKNLQQLDKLLILPIAELLPADHKGRVIFVPHSELFLVPFAALKDSGGKYLIEKHTILSVPSIRVLNLTQDSGKKVKQSGTVDALVVGNPSMPKLPPEYGAEPQQLVSLPGAFQEAKAIASLLNTKALTGNEATKTAVLERMPQAKIIHLATHGLFYNFLGLESAIVLAPNPSSAPGEQQGDNGLLTAKEILNLKLNADLVVLSACNTGRGSITDDGVIGLSRSLFIAGTPSVIVSLWSVPDAPTAELMTDFYTNLYQKKLDKAQALRMAMLHIMETHRDNPRDWAAFTLIGEAE